jgi:isopenicillin N synthase-like dioxygenase
MMPDDQIAPLIDIESPLAFEELDLACRSVGFFQVVGHGIPQETIDTMLEVATEFFRLPVEEKMRSSLNDPEVERGYSAKGTEGFSYSAGVETPPDLVEGFSMGRDFYPPDDPGFRPIKKMRLAFAPNVWPDRPAAMRAAMVAYYSEIERVARTLQVLMARALGLDEGFFDDKTDHSIDTLRVNYFSATRDTPPARPGQFGLGPHTDYGIITLLYATPVPGLQIADSEATWHDIMPTVGTLIVNLGDMTAQWTNDRWRSTIHRVVPLRSTDGRRIERLSVPFFREGNFDNLIECLPSCCSPDNPPRYKPVIGGEHLLAKFLGARVLQSASAVSTVGDRSGALQVELGDDSKTGRKAP